MKTRSKLLKMRAELYDRLAKETHQIRSPNHDDQLDSVARALAELKDINIVIEYDLHPQSEPEFGDDVSCFMRKRLAHGTTPAPFQESRLFNEVR